MRKEFIERLGGFPRRTPLKARVVGAIERDRFRVEKVLFESQPRHFVTALLYLPKQGRAPYPGVVVPSGHSATGKAAGYNQEACMSLAIHGIAALCYDPIGQGERSQFLDRNGKPLYRSTTEHTLVGSGCIPLGRSTATFRIYDGMRSIDYLCSRKEIDPKRIGVTGCSGGGTLSSYLMALDERVVCAAPSCYLTSFKRLIETIGPQDAEQNIFGQIAIGLDHADYVMLHAPRPTLILAATEDFFDIKGTWDCFRESKRFYTRLGHPERVNLVETPTRHGYPKGQRVPMVQWMRRWLLQSDEAILEPELTAAEVKDLQCSPKGQVQLEAGARSVVDLNVALNTKLKRNREQLWKNPKEALKRAREISGIRPLAEIVKGLKHSEKKSREPLVREVVLYPEKGIAIPGVLYLPKNFNGQRTLYAHGQGKQKDAAAGGAIQKLVSQGQMVLAIDIRGTGETASGIAKMWGGNWKDYFLAYLLGRSFVGMRAEDILAATSFLQDQGEAGRNGKVNVVAVGTAGPACLHAAALESKLFQSVTVRHSLTSWSALVSNPTTQGQLINTIHGALRAYDLTDLARLLEDRLTVESPVVVKPLR